MPGRRRQSYHHGNLKSTLVDAAVAMIAESQGWNFSLRAVARRAGVSHAAPHNHFPDKRDLLAAVAAVGYDRLRAEMELATSNSMPLAEALMASASTYVRFGTGNPALYRLMFGPALIASDGSLPQVTQEAAIASKQVLRDILSRGLRPSLDCDVDAQLDSGVLAAWSMVHGLTMLLNDGLAGVDSPNASIARQIDDVARILIDGLGKH